MDRQSGSVGLHYRNPIVAGRLSRCLAWWLAWCLLATATASQADPGSDVTEFRGFYTARFPTVALDDFVDGVYAIDASLRGQWEEITAFPPYEFDLDDGGAIFETVWANGATLGACLAEHGRLGVPEHPYYDATNARLVTLTDTVNLCRQLNGVPAYGYEDRDLIKLLAYLNYTIRGQRRNVAIPEDKAPLEVYAAGKAFFHAKQGQLNLSCADCHVTAAGRHLREQTLTPLLGVVNHYPVYGLGWGSFGTLHQRFMGCMQQVRAAALAAGSDEFKALEYFLAIMSNGLPLKGPGVTR